MTHRYLAAFLVGIFSFAFSHACSAADQTVNPHHPELLLDQADLDALKTKVEGPFSKQWAHWLAEADKLVAEPVELPPRGGNWSHNYVCPEHGARLTLGKKIGPWQWEHLCPVGNHILHGNPAQATTDFDGNEIREIHAAYAQGLVTLGVAYRVTGDARYATRAKEILLAYAGKYQSYPMHDGKGRVGKQAKSGGHVSTQPLTESEWLIPLTQGADLVWDTLSADERATVAGKILRPALDEVILRKNFGIQNMTCWENSEIGLVGFLLKDQKLVDRAIDDPKVGFRQQIAQGVMDDGMWLEGASGYHFFAIDGLWPLAEAARHHGIDLYLPRFKTMFNAPLDMAMPDGRLPNFNDSSIYDIGRDAEVYELAYARWKDPAYLPLFSRGSRSSRLALLYGDAHVPRTSATTRPAVSHNSPASGYAALQSGSGPDATWLCVKYGPHGGMHGHPDKNTFILYTAGEILAADAGSHAYGSPLHAGWDKTTIAHNTLVVDEKSQAPATGACLAFGSESGVDYVMTDAGPIYPDKDVKFVRTLAMIDAGTIVGIDRVTTGGKNHTLDIAFHLPGIWSNLASGEPWKSDEKIGYPFIEPATMRRVAASEPVTLNVNNHGRAVVLTMLGTGTATELITGAGIGASTEDRVPAAIFRRTGNDATYIWVMSFDGRTPRITALPAVIGATGVEVDGVQVIANTTERTVTIHRSGG